MYRHYYINNNEQSNGDHEVHREECSWLPNVSNRTYLGYLTSSFTAINVAQQKFPTWKINGYAHCCPESNTDK